MKRKNKNNKKKAYVKFFVLIISVYCVWNIIFTQAEISKKSKELEDIKEKYMTQLNDNNEYQNIISLESNEEYIKRIAREKLDFISQDDRVFIDISAR